MWSLYLLSLSRGHPEARGAAPPALLLLPLLISVVLCLQVPTAGQWPPEICPVVAAVIALREDSALRCLTCPGAGGAQ